MNSLTTTLGRLFFAVPFVVFGVLHFLNAENMAGMVPVPGGITWIYVTGTALIAAGLGIATKILGRWAAYGLALLLLAFVLTIHLPMLGDPKTSAMATGNLLKDLSLMGGALTWAGLLHARRVTRPAVRERKAQETWHPPGRPTAA